MIIMQTMINLIVSILSKDGTIKGISFIETPIKIMIKILNVDANK